MTAERFQSRQIRLQDEAKPFSTTVPSPNLRSKWLSSGKSRFASQKNPGVPLSDVSNLAVVQDSQICAIRAPCSSSWDFPISSVASNGFTKAKNCIKKMLEVAQIACSAVFGLLAI
jgi:hypothetical protein